MVSKDDTATAASAPSVRPAKDNFNQEKAQNVQPHRYTLSISRRGPEPLYYSLAQAVRHAVENGHWYAGQKLPTEEEMRLDMKLARNTVRKAWSCLEQAGIISRKQGAGTFIVGRPGTREAVETFTGDVITG